MTPKAISQLKRNPKTNSIPRFPNRISKLEDMSDCEGPEITANGAGAKQTMSDEITLKSERPNTEPTAKMGNGMDPRGDDKSKREEKRKRDRSHEDDESGGDDSDSRDGGRCHRSRGKRKESRKGRRRSEINGGKEDRQSNDRHRSSRRDRKERSGSHKHNSSHRHRDDRSSRKRRDRSRDRDRYSRRSRSRSRSRSRGRYYRDRRRDKTRDDSRRRRRRKIDLDVSTGGSSSDSSSSSTTSRRKQSPESMKFDVSLELVMRQNPRISMAEAFTTLQALKQGTALCTSWTVPDAPEEEVAKVGPKNASSRSGTLRDGDRADKTLPARLVCIVGFPVGVAAKQLREFVGQVMGTLQLTHIPGNTVQSLWISRDNRFAEAEFRSVEEACSALQLNSVPHKGIQVCFSRPSTYTEEEIVAAATAEGIADLSALMAKASAAFITTPAITTTATPTGETTNNGTTAPVTAAAPIKIAETPPVVVPALQSNVIMILDIPKALNESQVLELCSPFGKPERFNLIKNATEVSKNTAVCEYGTRKAALAALAGLDGLSLGLTSRLMAQNVPQAMADTLLQKMEVVDPEPECTGIMTGPTHVVVLANMLAVEDLVNNEEYEDILDDFTQECSQYGAVERVIIPRPRQEGSTPDTTGVVGKVFVKYKQLPGAAAAVQSLADRTFAGKKVKVHFYSQELFDSYQFEGENNEMDETKTIQATTCSVSNLEPIVLDDNPDLD